MDTRNYGNNPFQVDSRPNPHDMPEAKNSKLLFQAQKQDCFKNWKDLKFEGCFHEMIDYDLSRRRLPWATSTAQVHHYPEEISQTTHKEKAFFYLRLAEKRCALIQKTIKHGGNYRLPKTSAAIKKSAAIIFENIKERKTISNPSVFYSVAQ